MQSKICFLAVFGGVLVAVQAAFWLGAEDEVSALEKRVLAEPPRISLSRVASGRWMAQAEAYLTDHFPGREALIGAQAALRQLEGLNAVGAIYRGRDGWLLPAPLDADCAVLEANLDAMTAFVQTSGLPATLLAVPTAGAVLPDKLPALHDPYPDAALLAHIRALAGDTLAMPDLFAAFSGADDRESLYYRTDHHWTTVGAYTAYGLWCQAVGQTPVKREAFIVETHTDFYGTSYAKSGLWGTPPDVLELWEDQTLAARVTAWDDNKPAPVRQDSLFFRSHLQESDRYAVFLDGNHGRVRIETNRPGGRLLVIRDSFAHCLAPFLAQHYSQIDLIDLRYFKQQTVSAYLAEHPADAVLFCYGLDSLASDRTLAQLR